MSSASCSENYSQLFSVESLITVNNTPSLKSTFTHSRFISSSLLVGNLYLPCPFHIPSDGGFWNVTHLVC